MNRLITSQDNNVFTKYPEPNKFKEEMNNIKQQLMPILDEFKKLYILHNMHPTNQEYQQQYDTYVSGITQKLADLFTISNNIQNETTNLSKQLLPLDKSIKAERKKNIDLKRQLGIVKHKTNAADEMISNYKEIYDKNYLRNCALFLSALVGIYYITVVFKKHTVVKSSV